MGLTPEFYWAQRKDQIFLTLNVPNVKASEAQVKVLDDGTVYFRGTGGPSSDQAEYLLDVKLFKPINASGAQCNIGARTVQFKIPKAESGPYWDRLLETDKKNIHLKVDWDHWRDEDEEDNVEFGSQWASRDMADLDIGDDKGDDDDDDDDDVGDDDDDDDEDTMIDKEPSEATKAMDSDK